MFGTNPIRKQDLKNPLLSIQEIFPTLQGEGPLAGTPAIFIRLAGCNLKCHFCDTDFESNISNEMTVEDITNEIDKLLLVYPNISLVVLTGGEPMRQNLVPLCKSLLGRISKIQIETAGTLWIPNLEFFIKSGRVTIVCSPKTPKVHPMIFTYCDDWKYIITHGETNPNDGLPNKSTQVLGADAQLFRPFKATNIWVQPCDPGADFAKVTLNQKETIKVALEFGYRFSFQTHKALGLR